MRTSDSELYIRPRRRLALSIASLALLISGLTFVLAPLPSVAAARQTLMARLNANPAAEKMLSYAPAPIRRAVKSRLAEAATAPLLFVSNVTKSAVPATGSVVGRGNTIVYTINVTNDNSSETTNGGGAPNGFMRVVDTAPVGTLFQNASVIAQPQALSTSWTCAIGGGGATLTCSAGDDTGSGIELFTASQTLQIRVEAVVQNTAVIGSTLSNTATFQYESSDPDSALEESTDSNATSHLVNNIANLTLIKTASPPAVTAGAGAAGGRITYTLGWGNSGPDSGIEVFITDVIPANTLGVGTVSAPGFDCNGAAVAPGATLTCRATGPIAPNATGVISYSVDVPSGTPQGTIVGNVANIGTFTNPLGSFDPDSSTNTTVPTQTLVNTRADLGITKVTNNASPVVGGAAFSYTLVVTNNGPSDALGIIVTDALPPGINFQSVTVVNNPSSPGFALTCSGPAVGTNGVISCTGNLPGPNPVTAAISTSTITIVAQAAGGLASGVRTNTATVVSNTQEPTPNVLPNSASVQQNLVNNATLTITKTAPATACAGDNLIYNIAVTNSGNSSAINLLVSDVLPAGTTFLSVIGTGGFSGNCQYNSGSNTVLCSSDTQPPGTENITLVVKSSASTPLGAFINQASLSAGVGAISGANPAVGTTNIEQCADLALTKTAPAALGAGTTIDYVLTIRNNGLSDISGGQAPGVITVMDTLPVEVAVLVSALAGVGEPGGFTCTSAPGPPIKVTCVNAAGAPGNFPVGAVTNITIKVRILPNAVPGTNIPNCGMISAPTTVSNPQTDPNSSNNTSCASSVVSEILTVADLGVSKTAAGVVDPDGAGPLAPVALPVVGPNVPPGSVNAGGYIRYDLPFGNAGPADAVNVRLTDVLPSTTAFVGALATGGVFVPAAQPPAVPFTFTIQATDTVAPLGPNISLTCTVTGAAGNQQVQCIPQGNTGLTPSYADGTLPQGYQGTLVLFVKVNESVQGGTIVSNPANITSAAAGGTPSTPDPNTGNNTSSATSTLVVVTANLAITKIVQSAVTVGSNGNQTGPLGPATPPNGSATTSTTVVPGTFLTYRLTVTNNGPSDVSNIRVTDILPSALETPPGRVLGVRFVSATPVIPSGAIFTCGQPSAIPSVNNPQGNGGTLMCTAPSLSAIAPNNTAAIDILVFIDPATTLNLVNTATVDATLNNFNRPTSGTTVLTTPVPPRAGPASDQLAASILIFPIYASDAALPNRENTRMNITNTSTTDRACVHLFNIEGATCAVADLFVCLTPNQTTTMLASELDPGNRGYSIAVTVDCETGLPLGSNVLIGDEYVKFSSGHAANLPAWGIPAVKLAPAGVDPNVENVVLRFDGLAYNRLPRILVADNIGSRADNDSTLVIIDRIGGDMTESGLLIGNLFGWLYNDMEIGYSFTARFLTCQAREILSSTFPRTTPGINTVIPQGHSGWMKFWSTADGALIGSQINFNPDQAISAGAFNQGHNLHVLTLTSSGTLTIPVVVPFC